MGEFVTHDELKERLGPLSEIRSMLRENIQTLVTGQRDIVAQIVATETRITRRLDTQDVLLSDADGAVREAQLEAVIAHSTAKEAKAAIATVQQTVTDIKAKGCDNMERHGAVLDALAAAGIVPASDALQKSWKPTARKVTVGGGLVGIGVIVLKVIETVQAWITHAHTVVK